MILGLRLENFRSYEHLELAVPPGQFVFLIGPNGAGKTNLLEALSLLGGGRGLRGSDARDLIRYGHEGTPAWVVQGQVSKPPLRHTINRALTSDGKLSRLDGKPATGAALASLMPIVSLTPADDALFRGPSEDRRSLLDRFVVSMYPDHRGQLAAFNKALRERNRLLRSAAKQSEKADPAWLSGLEALMASHGVAVAHARRIYLAQLATAVAQGVGPFPSAGLALRGRMEAALEVYTAPEVEANWIKHWATNRSVDLAAGRTLEGPHRTDLAVTLLDKSMPAQQCSTGEQKALLLSLFLGQARLLQAAKLRPLMLLDEVAAHLDIRRLEALMEELTNLDAQTWITGTDRSPLVVPQVEDKSSVFMLENGALNL